MERKCFRNNVRSIAGNIVEHIFYAEIFIIGHEEFLWDLRYFIRYSETSVIIEDTKKGQIFATILG